MAKNNRKKKLVRFVHSELNNASKTLLANIRFSSIDGRMKTIGVTSSGPDEGKTIVATNLANAIATSGKRVLIVDCDMRNRCIYRLLDAHPRYGVYSVLSGQIGVEKAIVPTSIENLYFLDSEPGIPSPPDLLSTNRFEQMVDTLRDMFDFVIFDTPPVSLFVDAAIVSSVVDGMLFVLRQRKTKRAAAVDALQQLRTANAHILGTVLTFCAAEEDNYYYAYYSQDGKRVNKDKGANASGEGMVFKPLRDVEPARKASAASAPSSGAARHVGHERQQQAPAQKSRAQQASRTGSAGQRSAGANNPYAPNAYRSARSDRSGKSRGRER